MFHCLLTLPLIPPLIAQSIRPLPPSLQKTWRMELSGQTQVIKLTATEYEMKITGAGISAQGYTEKLAIAGHQVGKTASEGVIVLGPNPNLMQPYTTIFYYDLSPKSVRLLQDGKQYSSVAGALQAVGNREYARRFSAVP